MWVQDRQIFFNSEPLPFEYIMEPRGLQFVEIMEKEKAKAP